MLLPAPCQTLTQEVPIVLALPEEAPLLLHVKLAETQAWVCSFGDVPCPPRLFPVGLGSSQLPEQDGSLNPLAVPSLPASCLSFPFAACAITREDMGEPRPGARMAGEAQGQTILSGVIPAPKTASVGSPLLSAAPQGKLRQGVAGMEEWWYLKEELQLGTEAVQLPAPICHRQVLLLIAVVQLSHSLCGMAGLSWHSPVWAAGTLPHPTPSLPPPGSQPRGFLLADERGTCSGMKQGSRGSKGTGTGQAVLVA